MSAENGLLNDKYFRLAILSPLIISIMLAILIASFSELSIALPNKANIDFGIEFFKVPILIASLVFPLGAVAIANHRSEQNAATMALQRSQNNFANYWLHLEKFTEEVDKVGRRGFFLSIRELHDNLFPNANVGDITLNHEFIDKYLQYLDIVSKKLKEIKSIELNTYLKYKNSTSNNTFKELKHERQQFLNVYFSDLRENEHYTTLIVDTKKKLVETIEYIKNNFCTLKKNEDKTFNSLLDTIAITSAFFEVFVKFSGGYRNFSNKTPTLDEMVMMDDEVPYGYRFVADKVLDGLVI